MLDAEGRLLLLEGKREQFDVLYLLIDRAGRVNTWLDPMDLFFEQDYSPMRNANPPLEFNLDHFELLL